MSRSNPRVYNVPVPTTAISIEPHLQLDVDQDVLTLSVSHKESKDEKKEEEGTTWHHTERSHYFMKRSLRLPETADMDNIAATYKDGVLNVTVPKREVPETRKKITIG
jgi:HSP20 family protein